MQKCLPARTGPSSLPGTLVGLGAAGLTAWLGLVLGLVQDPWAALLVGGAAFLGTVVDSLIGARAPQIGNELTNVSCTLTAALLALALT